MNHNRIQKAASIAAAAADPPASSPVTAEELALINTYTRRPLTADEVYTFSVTLCDNDVDRDGERFPVESLFALEKLFVGKTGIFDHDPSAKNQAARIFACAVEHVPDRKTATGDDYFCLRARAYMPRTEDRRALIASIDSGIVKEVSVGCAVEKTLCSICGQEVALCPHRKGEVYDGSLCCGELIGPTDAYEWSFVAVPAQRDAGVTKAAGKERSMETILKTLENKEGAMLNAEECAKLLGYIDSLKQAAKDGVFYRDSLTAEVLRLSAAVQPDISRATMESMTKAMTVAQLKEVKTAFEKQKNREYAPMLQLCGGRNKAKNNTETIGQFTI